VTSAARRASVWTFVLAGLAVAVAIALVVSPHASAHPDGLEKVAADQHLDSGERAHALADGPLADYAVTGITDGGLSTGVAGLIGVAVTFAASFGLSAALRGRRRADHATAPPA
jgi:hypothetical protein